MSAPIIERLYFASVFYFRTRGVRLQFIVRWTIIPGGILTSIQYRDRTDIV